MASSEKTQDGLSLREICGLVAGQLEAAPSTQADLIKVYSLSGLENATASDLSYYAPKSRVKNAELYNLARETKAAALLVLSAEPEFSVPQIVVKHPLLALAKLAQIFSPAPRPAAGIHPTAVIEAGVKLGEDVYVGPYVVIGENSEIGDRSRLYPHVVLYPGVKLGKDCVVHAHACLRENTVLGDDCLIQNGAILGGDGFGYFPDPKSGHQRIPHIGNVQLGNSVDIGANTTVDRAMMGSTRIGDSSKLDNLVMVGHNTQLGARVLACGQVGISGSVKIASDVVLGGGVGVADHVSIARGAQLGARAGVVSDISEKAVVAGYPQQPIWSWRKEHALLRKLPELFKRTGRLEKLFNISKEEE